MAADHVGPQTGVEETTCRPRETAGRGDQYAAREEEEDMDWEIDDETLRALGGERLTVTLDVAELVPGTYVYLDADDEIIMRGAILDEDAARGVPPALPDFSDENDDRDTDPGHTIVGPLLAPRAPARSPGPLPQPSRTATVKGSPIQPRHPVPAPDQILNETDDDHEPRHPRPTRRKR